MDAIDARRARPSAWYALAVLATVTFCALLDRQILLLLAEPIRRDLALTDLQLGIVQGFGVALFAALAGYPLGWAADRFDRRIVLAACVAWWSAAVVGCALAGSFAGLLLSGAMVGAGEAGLAPVMYALIPALFVGRQRQVANSVAAMASVGGGALAFAVAGQIVAAAGSIGPGLPDPLGALATWRLSLLAAAALAPVMIFLIVSIRAPQERRAVMTSDDGAGAADASWFARHRSIYARFYLGGALGSFGFAALSVWLAVAAARVFGQTPVQIGAAFGVAQLASASCGFVLSVAVARIWTARLGATLPIRTMWIGMALAAVVVVSLPYAAGSMHLYVVYGVAGVFLTLAAMAFPTALQSISPPHLRGRAASIQFIVSMLVASGAPPLVGAVSDRLHGTAHVLTALAIVAVPALAIGAILLRSCEGRGLDALLAVADPSKGAAYPMRIAPA